MSSVAVVENNVSTLNVICNYAINVAWLLCYFNPTLVDDSFLLKCYRYYLSSLDVPLVHWIKNQGLNKPAAYHNHDHYEKHPYAAIRWARGAHD